MNVLDNRQRPLLIAHRGAPVYAPENTFASFQIAVDSGADIIETDLWFTSDGAIVCHHDETVDRVTDGNGSLPKMTLAEVKRLRVKRSYCGRFDEARYPDERVPTLQELLDFAPADLGLALELKDPSFARAERATQLVNMVRPRIQAGTAMLLSFNSRLLWAARRVEPSVWIGQVSMFRPRPNFRGNGVGTTYHAMKANPRYMKTARRHNLWVCPLDPTPEEYLDWYLEIDVDALLTDHPDVTHAALVKRGRR